MSGLRFRLRREGWIGSRGSRGSRWPSRPPRAPRAPRAYPPLAPQSKAQPAHKAGNDTSKSEPNSGLYDRIECSANPPGLAIDASAIASARVDVSDNPDKIGLATSATATAHSPPRV